MHEPDFYSNFSHGKWTVPIKRFFSLVDHSKHFYTTSNIHLFKQHFLAYTVLQAKQWFFTQIHKLMVGWNMGLNVLPKDASTGGRRKLGIEPPTLWLVYNHYNRLEWMYTLICDLIWLLLLYRFTQFKTETQGNSFFLALQSKTEQKCYLIIAELKKGTRDQLCKFGANDCRGKNEMFRLKPKLSSASTSHLSWPTSPVSSAMDDP